jgi:hypothetical protein
MSVRFVNIDQDTQMLFPVEIREWLPENYLIYFIIDTIMQKDVNGFKVNRLGSGSEQLLLEMMLAL